MKVVGGAVVQCSGPDGCCGGDEALMVQEWTAERCLKEVVGNRIMGMTGLVKESVDGKVGGTEIAHRQTDCIASRDVSVLTAAIDLILLLVVAVNKVAGATTRSAARRQHPIRTRPRG